MALKTEWVRYGSKKEFLGLLAWPDRAAGPIPGVVVLQEIWGVDAHIQDVTHRFAMAGYAALSPVLYAKDGALPPELAVERVAEAQAFMNTLPIPAVMDPKLRDGELAKQQQPLQGRIKQSLDTLFAGLLTGGLKLEQYLPATLGAAAYLRNESTLAKGQKVAALGYCMGGGLAALAACHDKELAAAVIFYGGAPAKELIPQINCPVAGFYGSLDKRLMDGLPDFTAAMKAAGKSFATQVYQGVQHAYFNDNRPAYHVQAARDSFARTLAFLNEHLAAS